MTITGTDLSNISAVLFGTGPAASVTDVSPTQVTAVSPSGAGSVGVTLTTPGGTSNPVSFLTALVTAVRHGRALMRHRPSRLGS